MIIKTSRTAYQVSDWLTYITHAEVDALKAIVNSLPPNPVVVNIGAGAGTSGLAIMEARDDVLLTTIDKTLESHPYGCLEGETVVLKNAGILPSAQDRYKQIHGYSIAIGEHWPERYNDDVLADFVFVDGDHSYEGVRGDIDMWTLNIKKGGIIAVHDYNKVELYWETQWSSDKNLSQEEYSLIKPWFHVDAAVDELLVPYYEKILHIDTLIAFRIT